MWLFTRKFGLGDYEGVYREIDMSQEWYCPSCLVPLELVWNHGEPRLDCPTSYHVCEYGYANLIGRQLGRMSWTTAYRYPLSKVDYLKAKIRKRDALIQSQFTVIQTARKKIEQARDEIKIAKVLLEQLESGN
ncbi:hypothetical protein RBG11_004210 [Vibrio parahaemolyticus]|nr:hypothetical protein [Vibrio parahaemolyticus]